jgi:Carbon-nitrogen hydrolase
MSIPDRLALTIAQLNPIVGDIAGNADKARGARAKAATAGADLVLLPELFICGYPPEDRVLNPALKAACRRAAVELAAPPRTGDNGAGGGAAPAWCYLPRSGNSRCVNGRPSGSPPPGSDQYCAAQLRIISGS